MLSVAHAEPINARRGRAVPKEGRRRNYESSRHPAMSNLKTSSDLLGNLPWQSLFLSVTMKFAAITASS